MALNRRRRSHRFDEVSVITAMTPSFDQEIVGDYCYLSVYYFGKAEQTTTKTLWGHLLCESWLHMRV